MNAGLFIFFFLAQGKQRIFKAAMINIFILTMCNVKGVCHSALYSAFKHLSADRFDLRPAALLF